MVEQAVKPELVCPECGWRAKNRAGLNGHRQFKHGIRPTAQLPLEPLDRLVTETGLANELMKFDARLFQATQQLAEQQGQLKQQFEELKQQLDNRFEQLQKEHKKIRELLTSILYPVT
jgi:cell shape-determining protein MreC